MKAYMVYNDTATMFFEGREDAETYACSGGAADYMHIVEIFIIPVQGEKDESDVAPAEDEGCV